MYLHGPMQRWQSWDRREQPISFFRKEIASAEDPDLMRAQKVQEYKEKFANPYVAAAKGYIDSVIEPWETRKSLLHALEVSGNKSVGMPAKKHGIPPF